jgi:F-type H+-transporting ATPase subunit gamma
MTERLKDIQGRITTTRQLASVVTAMEGIATARSRQAQLTLAGVRAYADTVAHAIEQALALLPAQAPFMRAPHNTHALIIICAEQGFAGLFNEHILAAADRVVARLSAHSTLRFIIGNRGRTVAEERKLTVEWSHAMISHPAQASSLAADLIEELYRRLDEQRISEVTLIHARPASAQPLEITTKSLIPFDMTRFAPKAKGYPPLTNLPPTVLLEQLIEEYVFAELCEALIHSFAAENQARMLAMMAAHENVTCSLEELMQRARQLRQEEITNELIELASSSLSESWTQDAT